LIKRSDVKFIAEKVDVQTSREENESAIESTRVEERHEALRTLPHPFIIVTVVACAEGIFGYSNVP